MRLFALILLVFPFFLNSQSIEIGKRIPASGETSYTDTLYIFDEGNASFTGGFLGFTPTWSPDDVGFGSFSYGVGPQASGFYSLAIGVQAKSEGLYSIALGNNVNALSESSIAIGSYASAEGQNTFATGESSRAIGLGSVAIGQSTRTEGMNSLAMGLAAKAKGVSSVAMGYLSEAEGNYSMAMGQGLEASSYNEVTIGSFNSIITPQSNNNWIAEDRLFVIGNGSGLGQTPERSDAMVVLKNGDVSFPDGDFLVGEENRPQPNVVSSGKLAFFDSEKGALRGGGLEVSKVWEMDSIGDYSIGLGLNVLAKGRASIALGSSAKARATGSICIGRTSQSEGGNSIGIGSFVSAIGGTSMALGYSSKSYGTYSISLGTFVNSPSYAEIVLGRYNTDYVPLSATSWNADDRLLVVGNGSSLGTKSDAKKKKKTEIHL